MVGVLNCGGYINSRESNKRGMFAVVYLDKFIVYLAFKVTVEVLFTTDSYCFLMAGIWV